MRPSVLVCKNHYKNQASFPEKQSFQEAVLSYLKQKRKEENLIWKNQI